MGADADILGAVLDACPDAILVADDGGRYVMANRAACELLGRTREQVLALAVRDVFADPEAEHADRLWTEFMRTGEQSGEARLVRPDRSAARVEFRARANFRPGLHLSVLRDVSEQARGEAMGWLRRGLERLLASSTACDALERAVALSCTGGGWDFGALWYLDPHAPLLRFVAASSAPAVRDTDRLVTAFADTPIRVGEHLVGAVQAADTPLWVDDLATDPAVMLRSAYAAAGLRSAALVPVRGAGSTVGVMAVFSQPARPRDAALMAGLCEALNPVGEALARIRSRREADRSRSEAAEARSIAQGITVALHAERRKIAEDLHDSVAQTLTMVKLAVARAAPGGDRDTLDQALVLVDDVIGQIRTMIFDLHPPMLEVLGLAPTLERYAELVTRSSGVQVLVSEVGPRRALASLTSEYLFRVVKELIGNVVSHARATEGVVCVRWEPEELRITVDDDGVGMDEGAVQLGAGLGLPKARERLRALGGALEIESRPGQGTRVLVSVPLEAQPVERTR